MYDRILFGQDLGQYVAKVREAAHEAGDMRSSKSHSASLRDMGAWTALRAAQRWIARREPPRQAWQGERVRRTALQIGYARPVMEGGHVGLIRASMMFDKLTYDVLVFPEGIVDRSVQAIASSLIHEATHRVHREVFCERFEVSPDEAFVICDLNDRERPRTVLTAEALAFLNQTYWTLTHAPEEVGEGGRHEMVLCAANAIRRPHEGMHDFVDALKRYAIIELRGMRPSGLNIPLVHLYGNRAGLPIVVTDLAPLILEPITKLAGF